MNHIVMMLNDRAVSKYLPREKIEKFGAAALTNEELLALNGRYRELYDTQFSMDRDIC